MADITNEFGRKIAIKVERLGHFEFPSGYAQGVRILMISPNSEYENVITEMEAQELFRQLGEEL